LGGWSWCWDAAIQWPQWTRVIEPLYYGGVKGRKPKPLETMLRMYLLQAWFSLSDEGVEDAVYDCGCRKPIRVMRRVCIR
jgi:hypothetical protein